MSIQTIDMTLEMEVSFVVFNSIVLLFWLPLWSTPSFCMFPHCDYSFHSLCNTC
jgi:hypothetical protein